MGRKAEPGILYFQVDSDHYDDKGVKLLIKDCGGDGYMIWMFLRSYAFKKYGYYFDLKDSEELELFAIDICKKPLELVQQVITSCLARGLFSKAVHEQHSVLTSVEMQEMYLHATSDRRRVNKIVTYLILEYLLLEPAPDKETIRVVGLGEQVTGRAGDKAGDEGEQPAAPVKPKKAAKVKPEVSEGEQAQKDMKAAYEGMSKEFVPVMNFIKDRRPLFPEPYVDFWNIWAVSNGRKKSKVAIITTKRKAHINARLKEPLFDIISILKKAAASEWCCTSHHFDFDFISRDTDGYAKVLEGKYDNDQKVIVTPTKYGKPDEPEQVNPSLTQMVNMINTKFSSNK